MMSSPTARSEEWWTRLLESVELQTGPRRILAVSTLVNTTGSGLFITAGALYFTRVVGLSVMEVGGGLTVAGFVALAAGIPVGRMADRWGPRRLWALFLVLEACAMAGFLFVSSFPSFVAMACVSQFAAAASQTARMPVFRRIGGANATRLRAVIRSLVNIGTSFGALAAGIVIAVDTRFAYTTLILANAITFACNVLLVLLLPRLEPLRSRSDKTTGMALRDPAFLAVTALNGVLALQGPVLTFAIPLWIVQHTEAPRSIVAILIVINTVMIALLQLSATKGINGVMSAGNAARSASFGLLVAFALFGWASAFAATIATSLLIIGVIVLTLAELRYAAAEFELSFGLVPAHLQGEYSGVFGLGQGLAASAGPYLLAVLVLGVGTNGWIALGVLMVAAGLLVPPAVAWAERTRSHEPEVGSEANA
ncbi:MFS transporter [Nonomuraea longispora]|uniref:MFS transporter n=2 Tax=Nonomuraea longispora TaxID=1848320 RepID=A0A4V2XJJ2_9ACTN|nr:MFS transporter [Nonomuraea longispora]